jgi:hypothetical protein
MERDHKHILRVLPYLIFIFLFFLRIIVTYEKYFNSYLGVGGFQTKINKHK